MAHAGQSGRIVDGVMSIQGDGSAVHKAKDHSRALSPSGISCNCVVGFSKWEMLARDGELDALKGACPVREGLYRDRLFCASKYGAMTLLHRAHSNIADTDLRDRVERQLDWEPEITSTDIGVATDNGVVTLTGFVDSYAEKLAAERVTLKTYGVSAVANEIQVKLLFKKTDTDIASAALDALQARVDVPHDKIKLTVKDGWIALEGNVDWYYQKNAAEFAVKYLSGVKGITDNIKLKPQVSTIEVKDKIEDALKRSAEVDARRISVQAADGKVTLMGNVRSWFEKQEAATAAWAAPGVKEVNNQIMVVP